MRQNGRTLLLTLALLLALVALPSAALAQSRTYRTHSGYVGCLTLTEFNEQSDLLASGDKNAWASYIASHNCTILKAGIEVYMQNAKGLGIIKIRPKGTDIWIYTNTETVAER
jgi:hypothetical protein